MANQDTKPGNIPPYLPYSTFRTFLETLKVGVPARIDRSVMPNYSGGIQSWILAALRFFGLISEDGVPTARLTRFVNADDEEKKKQIRELVVRSYPNLFRQGFDLKSITARQLEEEFNSYKLSTKTVDRCISFFTGAAREAGIELSPHLKKTRKRRSNANGGAARQAPRRTKTNKPQEKENVFVAKDKESIPIALGPGKTWNILMDKDHSKEDIRRFLQIAALVLGHESE